MSPEVLFLVNISTVLIAILGFYLSYLLFRKYSNNLLLPTLFLSLFSMVIGILYVFVFLLRFPSEEDSIAMMSSIIPLGVFISQAVAPLFSASFAALTISPKHGKWLAALFLALTLYCVILIILNPPLFAEAYGGIVELVCHENTIHAMWITLGISLIAPAFLVYYAIIVRSKEQRAKGILLSLSFFALSYLINYQENFGTGTLLYVRRILIFIAMVLLYVGFTLPDWLKRIVHLS